MGNVFVAIFKFLLIQRWCRIWFSFLERSENETEQSSHFEKRFIIGENVKEVATATFKKTSYKYIKQFEHQDGNFFVITNIPE